jgi:hypothetical protein
MWFREKSFGEKLFGEKPFGKKSFGEKSFGEKLLVPFWGKVVQGIALVPQKHVFSMRIKLCKNNSNSNRWHRLIILVVTSTGFAIISSNFVQMLRTNFNCMNLKNIVF